MTVYGFRHSFATLMSENGMDKEVLREIMEHADFETTEFYYIFISDKRKKEEFKKASHKSFETEKETKLKGTRFTKKKIKALKNKCFNNFPNIEFGAPRGIRTPDLSVRSRVLYPTKLLVQK